MAVGASGAATLRAGVVVAVLGGSLAWMLSLDPIAQDLAYHDFADRRPWLGIPNCGDVVANLRMSLRQFERCAREFRELGVPWLALGGGGYDVSNVVRAWTLAWSVITETDLPDEIPPEWLTQAARYNVAISKLRGNIERTPTDGSVLEDLDRTIESLRESVFPILGVTE